VVTAHAGDPAAYSWRLAHLALGDAVLGPPAGKRERGADPQPPAPATAVALSSCGNFALVGSAAGRVDRYNMQSGLHRGFYARCAARSASVLIPGMSAASPGWRQGRQQRPRSLETPHCVAGGSPAPAARALRLRTSQAAALGAVAASPWRACSPALGSTSALAAGRSSAGRAADPRCRRAAARRTPTRTTARWSAWRWTPPTGSWSAAATMGACAFGPSGRVLMLYAYVHICVGIICLLEKLCS